MLQMKRQRYSINLLIDKQYYRNKNFALIRAGERAAESRFERAVAKTIRTKEKRRHDITVTIEAKVIVAKALNARLKLVNSLKSAALRLQRHCGERYRAGSGCAHVRGTVRYWLAL